MIQRIYRCIVLIHDRNKLISFIVQNTNGSIIQQFDTSVKSQLIIKGLTEQDILSMTLMFQFFDCAELYKGQREYSERHE